MNRGSGKSILIIGGGVAGMSAARALAGQGAAVHLVEKNDHLGGKAFDWACMATDKCEYCGACLSAELVYQVNHSENITIYKECGIKDINKIDDGYHVSVKGSRETEIDVQAIILAMGFDPFNPEDLKFFEYNKKGVITSPELNGTLKNEGLPGMINHDSPSIAFIQCVGSRNREIGQDYCSQVCCKTVVRFSNKILHLMPDASITIFHMDLQTCGKMFRTQIAELGGRVKLIQGIPGKALPGEEDKIRLIQEDIATGSRKAYDFDQVVLTVGMKSGEGNSEIADMLDIKQDKWGFIHDPGTKDKNVYTIGTTREPMDIISSMEQGFSAACEILNSPGVNTSRKIAILGKEQDGRVIAKAMNEAGHNVHLFEKGNGRSVPEGVKLYSGSRITGISGTAGQFRITARSDDKLTHIDVEAIIVANGMERIPFVNEEIIPVNDNIISLSEFEEQFNGEFKNIVFWLDHSGPEWKSSSRKALTSAIELAKEGRSVSIIMEKMLVNGLDGQEIYDNARKQSIKFLRVASPADVKINNGSNGLSLEVNEATLGGVTLNVPCELLVIPEQVRADSENILIAELLALETDTEGFHQHPNPRHRRVGSTRKGIYYAGSCHDETDDNDLSSEIRVIKSFLNLIPPNTIENSACAEIDKGKCGRCLTCFRVCPHDAVILDGHKPPLIVEDACFGCGLCITSCPAEAISLKDHVKPEEESEFKGTVIFACTRSAFLAEMEYRNSNDIQSGYKIIPVDCACSLDSREVMDQLLGDAEKIMVMTCHTDNCRSTRGYSSARSKIARIYNDTGIPRSMLTIHPVAANEPVKFKNIIEETAAEYKESSNE
ncbi:FAD-dependent oxidoreductase [Thermodesulfobacteriota bacterium]